MNEYGIWILVALHGALLAWVVRFEQRRAELRRKDAYDNERTWLLCEIATMKEFLSGDVDALAETGYRHRLERAQEQLKELDNK